jgi:hypothetical protein
MMYRLDGQMDEISRDKALPQYNFMYDGVLEPFKTEMTCKVFLNGHTDNFDRITKKSAKTKSKIGAYNPFEMTAYDVPVLSRDGKSHTILRLYRLGAYSTPMGDKNKEEMPAFI